MTQQVSILSTKDTVNTRKHVNKETGETTYTYYHNVLEGKLILGDFVFSLGTEFIENEDEFVEKQDCERKAFDRLSRRIKKNFPRLPICILADSLYASGPVMDTCKANKWSYIIRFKKGSIKNLNAEFEAVKLIQKSENTLISVKDGIEKNYAFVNKKHQAHEVSILELEEEKKEKGPLLSF